MVCEVAKNCREEVFRPSTENVENWPLIYQFLYKNHNFCKYMTFREDRSDMFAWLCKISQNNICKQNIYDFFFIQEPYNVIWQGEGGGRGLKVSFSKEKGNYYICLNNLARIRIHVLWAIYPNKQHHDFVQIHKFICSKSTCYCIILFFPFTLFFICLFS